MLTVFQCRNQCGKQVSRESSRSKRIPDYEIPTSQLSTEPVRENTTPYVNVFSIDDATGESNRNSNYESMKPSVETHEYASL